MTREAPLSVEVPPPGGDRPAWGKVGLLAAAGFVVGVAGPHLAGLRIAPKPPNDAPAAAAIESARPAASAAPPAPPPVASAAPAASAAPPGPRNALAIGAGTIVRCRDAKNRPREECGTLPFDTVATPRLQRLAACPAASQAVGKLAIGFDVDFKRKAVHVQRIRGSTLPKATVDGLLKCATTAFADVPLDEVEHAHARYGLAYAVAFAPGAEREDATPAGAGAPAAAGTTSNEVPASGTATVAFDAAVVRDQPKVGNVVGRVLRGGKVRLLGRQADWYHVSFGAAAKDGWMHRSALGL